MTIAVIAEKPSVARDIAKVLGARQRGEGFLHGNGYVVTWAIGHLVRLAEPHEIDPDWKRWRREAAADAARTLAAAGQRQHPRAV
jgi:DNA topoisomerase-3